jgi:hypothetical protein
MKTALVMIDLQQGSFTPLSSRYDAAGLVSRLNGLAHAVGRPADRFSSSMTVRPAIRIIRTSQDGGCCRTSRFVLGTSLSGRRRAMRFSARRWSRP